MKLREDRLSDTSLKNTNWVTLLIAIASMIVGAYFINNLDSFIKWLF